MADMTGCIAKLLLVLAFVLGSFFQASEVLAQAAAELTIAKSPATNSHVALQPRTDHHRIHFLARAKNLKDTPCEAVVICTKSGIGPGLEIQRTNVFFTPTKNDQTFAIYIRTPKIQDSSVKYFLNVKLLNPWDMAYRYNENRDVRAAYRWEVVRDNQGKADVQGQQPGTTEEVEETVAKAVAEEHEGPNGVTITKMVLVYETRLFTLSVPDDFKFSIDTTNAGEVYNVARPLN
ncbi:hypothetical protein [Bremerella volcania]|uniref:hypothetical protein n=1 Tax=Bremerella volcania TaxID=2527984 RepID=UPI0011A581D5|nr:hypothetical protein [Bremerella volcania]